MELLPARFVTSVVELPEAVLAQCADVPILLVRLEAADETSRLARGLSASASTELFGGGESEGEPQTRTRVVARVKATGDEDAALASRSRRVSSFNTGALQKVLAAGPHFAAILAPRHTARLDPRVRVGRRSASDIVLKDASVSSKHAWIDSADDTVFRVTDAGSTNGTFVNGERVEGNRIVEACAGDVIRFGSVEATLCLLGMLRTVLVRIVAESAATS